MPAPAVPEFHIAIGMSLLLCDSLGLSQHTAAECVRGWISREHCNVFAILLNPDSLVCKHVLGIEHIVEICARVRPCPCDAAT